MRVAPRTRLRASGRQEADVRRGALRQQHWCYCRDASLCCVFLGPRVFAAHDFTIALSLAHSTLILFFILPYTRRTCFLWLSVILSGRRLRISASVVIVSKFYVFCLSAFSFFCLFSRHSWRARLDDGRSGARGQASLSSCAWFCSFTFSSVSRGSGKGFSDHTWRRSCLCACGCT